MWVFPKLLDTCFVPQSTNEGVDKVIEHLFSHVSIKLEKLGLNYFSHTCCFQLSPWGLETLSTYVEHLNGLSTVSLDQESVTPANKAGRI